MIASTQTNHPLAHIQGDPTGTPPLQLACNRLKSAGLRITQPRIAILEALINRSLPASIEQLHADLQAASASSCDLVTVYRCLAAFEELGLVRRCFFHNGTSLYQLNLTDTPTYHVVDKATNEVVPLDPELALELQEALHRIQDKLADRGFTQVSHMVEFFGRPARSPDRTRSNVDVPADVHP